jgi:two-component sensor histidine kinase
VQPVEPTTLRFHWSEMGGPPVTTPKRRGFGSRVIENIVRAEFQGQAKIDFHKDGILYEIVAPLDRLTDNFDAYSGRASAET